MKSYTAITDVREITQDATIPLAQEEGVLGYSIECPSDSTSNATLQINGSPKLALAAGDPSRPFGGFLGDMPVIFKDEVKISFTTPGAGTRVLIIIIRIQC